MFLMPHFGRFSEQRMIFFKKRPYFSILHNSHTASRLWIFECARETLSECKTGSFVLQKGSFRVVKGFVSHSERVRFALPNEPFRMKSMYFGCLKRVFALRDSNFMSCRTLFCEKQNVKFVYLESE